MSKKVNINYAAIRKLAAHICDLQVYDDATLEQALKDKFDTDMESFSSIIEYIYPLIEVCYSPDKKIIHSGLCSNNKWFIRTQTPVNDSIFFNLYNKNHHISLN